MPNHELWSETNTPFDAAEWAAGLARHARPDVVTAVDLGRTSFERMAAVQSAYLDLRRSRPSSAGDVLLLLEHEPVITMSRRARPEHVLWSAETCAARGVAVAPVDRGGDVTFHGPGQIVAYPLLDLDAPRFRLGSSAYMHRLEAVVVATLARFGLAGRVEPNMPGVWVPRTKDGQAAKICAIGTRVSRGLSKHGFALNHTVDLEWFSSIVPCGLPLPVTSLAEMLGEAAPTRDEVLRKIVAAFESTFAVPVRWHATQA